MLIHADGAIPDTRELPGDTYRGGDDEDAMDNVDTKRCVSWECQAIVPLHWQGTDETVANTRRSTGNSPMDAYNERGEEEKRFVVHEGQSEAPSDWEIYDSLHSDLGL